MRISRGLTQAYDLQNFTYDAAIALRQQLTGEDGRLKITREDSQAICALVKAWEACQYRIQVHRRVPNPGSLKHPVTAPKRQQIIRADLLPEALRVEPPPADSAPAA